MKNEIIVAVVSSAVTGVIMFSVANSIGVFKKTINESQLNNIASEIVNKQDYRDVIIRKMESNDHFKGSTGDRGEKGLKGDAGENGRDGNDSDWVDGAIKPITSVARAICYSSISGSSDHSIILVPFTDNSINLDAKCSSKISNAWKSVGIAKGGNPAQDCSDIENNAYGGGFTSFISSKTFEANRDTYKSCNSSNAFICCSTGISR